MEEQSTFQAARLRERATHCKKLALGASSNSVARELQSIAQEYEDDAEKLELRMPLI
jgi:hypothetical protein